MPDPVVFISSTFLDLKDYRDQAAKAASVSQFSPRRMEDFVASGHVHSLPFCREMVDGADVVVAIVGHRYGWVPPGVDNPDGKSITWLECEHAWNSGKEVLAFLVDPDSDWDPRLFEGYRLTVERKKPGILDEVERNEKKLAEFKEILGRKVCSKFDEPMKLRAEVIAALGKWRERNLHAGPVTERHDPDAYLNALEADTRRIRITGLTTKRAEPYFFGIDEIYIPLTTTAAAEEKLRKPDAERVEERHIVLQEALSDRRILIIGEPGSGKSIFLRRVAFELCRAHRGATAAGAAPFLTPGDKRFPILIRVADLAAFLAKDEANKPADAPDWIPHFLGKQSALYNWGVGESFFREKLNAGHCLLILDGLDEAPERRVRERIARLLERATVAYAKCDFLVSTRPQTNRGYSVPADFKPVRIDRLGDAEIQTFFDHFARALALNDVETKSFQDGLKLALESRAEIREMAANPIMLTALAVLQHNDQQLPEHRVDLYRSILGWLALAREQKEGRPSADRCLEYLRRLALFMQNSPEGRLVQVNKRDAAGLFAREFGGTVEWNETLLEGETLDSGIVSSAGPDLKFWHLSFQEYLAAREIASFSDKVQVETVLDGGKLYRPEWRETMRLLGGELRQMGEPKIEGLVQAILAEPGEGASLAARVRCVALLGDMMRDLAGMGYQPKSSAFRPMVLGIAGIFEKAGAEGMELADRIRASDLLGKVGDPRFGKDNIVAIPAGKFLMGARKDDKEAYPDESPVREITLGAYSLGRYPVTVGEFGAFLEKGGYDNEKYWSAGGYGKFSEPEGWLRQQGFPTRPVVGVSWFEAAAYCAWKGRRLPTEAEWERAARGPKRWKYPWGNSAPDASRANYNGTGLTHPTPVGLFPNGDSSEGLSDLSGNVFEWCGDWFGSYEPGSKTNPAGLKDGTTKVLRGGCWYNDAWNIRASYRNDDEPGNRIDYVGFRVGGGITLKV